MNPNITVSERSILDPSRFFGSLLIGVISGGLAGLVGGVLARVAMRVVAVGGGMTPSFSIGGTMGILFISAILGAGPGLLYAVTLPIWQAPPRQKGLVIGAALALLLSAGLLTIDAEGELALIPVWITTIMFAGITLVYGFLMGVIAERLSPEMSAQSFDTAGFLRTSAILTLIAGLVTGSIELLMAAAFPVSSLVGWRTAEFLEGASGIAMSLAMIAGLAGLLRSGAAGDSRPIQLGLGIVLSFITILGLGSLFYGSSMIEVHGLVKVISLLEFNPDLLILLVLLGAGVIFLSVAGIAVVRAGIWSGWHRYIPLAVGLVPILSIPLLHPALLPELLDVSVFGRAQLGHWVGAGYGLTWLALGLAMRAEANQTPETG